MEDSVKILSDITVYNKYAKYIPEIKRRETWEETVMRDVQMNVNKFPSLEKEIYDKFSYVINKDVLPSMRMLQFAGLPVEINNARGYNCSFAAVNHIRVFSEAMFLLLSGCGFSYSVQKHHVEKLPELLGPSTRKRNYLVEDSIIGWADAVKVLIEAYFYGKSYPVIDYRDIRPKGSRLVTSGGKAPGPAPLKECIFNIQQILDRAIEERGSRTKLKTIEAHDILCFIADAVLSGGIRRASCLAGFSFDDEEMLSCKTGDWYDTNPQRQRSNNSVILLKRKLDRKSFDYIFDIIQQSQFGEPGIIITNDKDYMFNPCGEASLKSETFCNLTTVNMSTVKSQEDFNARAKIAAFIGTLQASYTDFHYLRESWRRNTEKDSLLGVSMTGLASEHVLSLDFEQAANIVKEENVRVAELIGINPAARTTLIKPEGTASIVLGCSNGVHSWHSPYYIRRMRLNKDEPLYKYLIEVIPELIEDEYFKPKTMGVLSMPIKAPEDAITRDKETAIDLIDRCIKLNKEWIKPGHISGANTHNVSATISIKDKEWNDVREHVWKNLDYINGMTFFKYDGGSYKQAPFEECDKSTYESMMSKVRVIELSKIVEEDNLTDHKQITACSAGGCEIQ